jgi:DNA-binding transcriptional regulator LsrR (DeoR family)
MPGRKRDEAQRLLACMAFANGQKVGEIAKRLGHDRTTIMRWLQDAEKDKWIDRHPRLTLPADKLRELAVHARDTEKEKRLLDLLSGGDSPLREALVGRIIPPLDPETRRDEDALADRLRDVTGRLGAWRVHSLVQGAKGPLILGATWGGSLRQLAVHLEALVSQRDGRLTCYPLIGDLAVLGKRRQEFVTAEANAIANRITRAYGGNEVGYLAVPAWLPRDEARLEVLREYFQENVLYQEIFGSGDGTDGRIWEAYMCAVGIGGIRGSAWPQLTHYIDERDRQALEDDGVVGDIAARFLKRGGLHEEDCSCLTCSTNRRVLGIELRTLSALAHDEGPPLKAPRGGRRHVIALVSGAQKADAIIAASRLCLTTLVTDEETAQAVIDRLEDEAKSTTGPGAPGPARRRQRPKERAHDSP